MELKTNIRKSGTSYQVIIPSSIIKVFNLLNFLDTHYYQVTVENEGKKIVLNRKKHDKEQTTLEKY
jgi:antitoxin component of MazEF toxin-antitoxin module